MAILSTEVVPHYSRVSRNGTHSSALAWKIPWMEEPGGLQSMGSLEVGHDWVTLLSLFTFMHWRRKWQPTLPGASVRNSAHGKGHEEGGFGIRKGGIKPQETPCSQASTPKTRVYLLYCFMLSPTPLTLWGAVPHLFSQKRSKLAAAVNKNSWGDKGVSGQTCLLAD